MSLSSTTPPKPEYAFERTDSLLNILFLNLSLYIASRGVPAVMEPPYRPVKYEEDQAVICLRLACHYSKRLYFFMSTKSAAVVRRICFQTFMEYLIVFANPLLIIIPQRYIKV